MAALRRRRFLGLTAGAVVTTGCATSGGPGKSDAPAPEDRWAEIRAEFDQDPAWANMAGFLLAPHPRPVREAIARHRKALDRNPAVVLEAQMQLSMAGKESLQTAPRTAAARFIGAHVDDVALTDSTTMGLGLVYGGIEVGVGREVLVGSQGHFSTIEALRLRQRRDGTGVRQVDLYDDPAKVSVDEVVTKLLAGIGDTTRVVGATWVHSSTGVKMPIRAMADAIAEVNDKRDEGDRVLFVVDGVHAFGLENFTAPELGCDVFIAGCHKWLFGPRGTGIIWAKREAWARIVPTIPAFEAAPFLAYLAQAEPPGRDGLLHTPGGFHSFEHRWALAEAFAFQAEIGRAAIEGRVHELNTHLKEGLADNARVHVFTPRAAALSAGITCFEVEGVPNERVVEHLMAEKIIASVSPYRDAHARLAPGLLNNPAEVDAALRSLARL